MRDTRPPDDLRQPKARIAAADVYAAGSAWRRRLASGSHSTGTLRMIRAPSSSAVPGGKIAASSKNDECACVTDVGSTFHAEVFNPSPSNRFGRRVAEYPTEPV